MFCIDNAVVLTPSQRLDGHSVHLDDHQIAAVAPTPKGGDRRVDASGLFAVPGFVDLQLNGGFGHDFTADPETIWTVAAELPRYGVTSFLPTIITSPLETVAAAQQVLAAGPPEGWQGAVPLGLHVEGPFLEPDKKGAHDAAYLRPPTLDAVKDFSPEKGVRLVTMAPELSGAQAVIEALDARGVVVSAGHSLATLEEANAAFTAGIRYGTHLFNAMPPLGHREPALAGALLAAPDLTVGLIADGLHVHPAMIDLTWRAKGAGHITLVTDAMAALGMPKGSSVLGGQSVTVGDDGPRLADGRLAGSILSMDAALRNFIEITGASLAEVMPTVSTTPAQLLRLPDRGRIAPGMTADVVLLTPELEVAMTIVEGEIVYST